MPTFLVNLILVSLVGTYQTYRLSSWIVGMERLLIFQLTINLDTSEFVNMIERHEVVMNLDVSLSIKMISLCLDRGLVLAQLNL